MARKPVRTSSKSDIVPRLTGPAHLSPTPMPDDAVRITAIETSIPAEYGTHLLAVRIHTEAGVVGCGETYYIAPAMQSLIHDFMAARLLGADALAIESHWRFLYERMANIGARGAELRALSAVDVALWDILGQVCGKPVYRLLGGPVRDRVLTYNSCANSGYSVRKDLSQAPATVWPGMGPVGSPGPGEDSYNYFVRPVELAQELIELGYTAMKIWPLDVAAIQNGPTRITQAHLRQALRPLEAIRNAVGWDIEVMIDGHGHFQLPAALRIADALRPLGPLWLEDIIKMDNLDTVADFRRQSRMPISVSEMLQCAPDYAYALEKRAADYIMIDPTWVGGISETIRIARMAQVYNIPASMHDATGPFTLLSGMHCLAALPGGLYQETARAQIAVAYKRLIEPQVVFEKGNMLLPRTPGIGARWNPDLFKKNAPGYRVSRLEKS
jgi:L-alanine-DL-glutamate epimerase-like enolase superfamily enzyme